MKELDKGRLGELDATRHTFNQKVEGLHEESQRHIGDLQHEIGTLSNEKRVLENTLQQKVALVVETQNKFAAAEKAKDDLQQKLHTLTAQYEEMDRNYSAMKTTVATQNFGDVKKISQLEVDLEEAQAQLVESRRTATVAQGRISALEKELDELRHQQVRFFCSGF